MGSLIQKLKAGAAAEAMGEQNPGLMNSNNSVNNNDNNDDNINISSSNKNNINNNNEKGRGKGKGKKIVMKALLKQKQSCVDEQKQSVSKKMAENEVQNQAQMVDWSAWDNS